MTFTTFAAEYALRLIALVAVVGIGLAVVRPALARTRLYVWTLVLSVAWLMPLAVAFMPEVTIPLLAAFSAPEFVVTGADNPLDEVTTLGTSLSTAPSSWTVEQFVTCQLLANELVERFVLIERANDVVAKPPRLRAEFVPVETVAIAVTHDIQPHPRKMFAETWSVEQVVDQLGNCLLDIV